MIKSCCLITPIAPSYLRNNRSTRQKSLRCFPTCSPKGHIMGGFCGQSLRVKLTLNIEPFQNRRVDVNEFVFICEIRPSDEPRIAAETTVRKATVLDKVRSKQDKDIGKELFMGEVDSCEQVESELNLEVIFNGRHHSWDYSWKSNRWSEQQHVVDIIVLTYDSPLDFRVAGVFTSSQFMILSSHKKSSKGEKPTFGTGVISLATSRINKPAAVATITAAAAGGGSNDTTDQDLLDASTALSMLAGGGVGGALTSGKRTYDERDADEKQEHLPRRNSRINLSNMSITNSSGILQPLSMDLTDMVLLPRSKVNVGGDLIPTPMSLAMAGSSTDLGLSAFENNIAHFSTTSQGQTESNHHRSSSSTKINPSSKDNKPRQSLSILTGEVNPPPSRTLSQQSRAISEENNLVVLPNKSRTEASTDAHAPTTSTTVSSGVDGVIGVNGINGVKPTSSSVLSNMGFHYGQHADDSDADANDTDTDDEENKKEGMQGDKNSNTAPVNTLYHFPPPMPVMPTTTIASIAAATLKDFNTANNPAYPLGHEPANDDMILLMPRNKKAKLQ